MRRHLFRRDSSAVTSILPSHRKRPQRVTSQLGNLPHRFMHSTLQLANILLVLWLHSVKDSVLIWHAERTHQVNHTRCCISPPSHPTLAANNTQSERNTKISFKFTLQFLDAFLSCFVVLKDLLNAVVIPWEGILLMVIEHNEFRCWIGQLGFLGFLEHLHSLCIHILVNSLSEFEVLKQWLHVAKGILRSVWFLHFFW